MAAPWQPGPGQQAYSPYGSQQQQYSGYPAVNNYGSYYGQGYPQGHQYQQGYSYPQQIASNPQGQNWKGYQYNSGYPAQWYPQTPAPSYSTAEKPAMTATTPITEPAKAAPVPDANASATSNKVSCYNCQSTDHWAVNCPNTIRTTNPHPSTQAPPARQGPIVTKYAVPPHIAASMKARGVQGAPSTTPASASFQQPQYPHHSHFQGQWPQPYLRPYHHGQYPGQQWYPPSQIVSPQPGNQQWQPHQQSSLAYQVQSTQWQGSQSHPSPQIQIPMTSQPLSTPATQVMATKLPIAETKEGSSTEADPAAEATSLRTKTLDAAVENRDAIQDADEEDDFSSLDIPDMPKSFGTVSYHSPKLLAKPMFALAPEWTQSGLGEINICKDPNGRTQSDYIKPDDPDSGLKMLRTAALQADPIFALIEFDEVAPRPHSRSSGSPRSVPGTTKSNESAGTQLTPADDSDRPQKKHRRSRSGSSRRWSRHTSHISSQDHSPKEDPQKNQRYPEDGRHYYRRNSYDQGRKRRRDESNNDFDEMSTEEPLIKKQQVEPEVTKSVAEST